MTSLCWCIWGHACWSLAKICFKLSQDCNYSFYYNIINQCSNSTATDNLSVIWCKGKFHTTRELEKTLTGNLPVEYLINRAPVHKAVPFQRNRGPVWSKAGNSFVDRHYCFQLMKGKLWRKELCCVSGWTSMKDCVIVLFGWTGRLNRTPDGWIVSVISLYLSVI